MLLLVWTLMCLLPFGGDLWCDGKTQAISLVSSSLGARCSALLMGTFAERVKIAKRVTVISIECIIPLIKNLGKFLVVSKITWPARQLEEEHLGLSSLNWNLRWKFRETAPVKNLATELHPNILKDIKEKVFSLVIFLSLLTEHL